MLIDNHILEDKYFFRLAAIFKEKGWAIDKSTDDEYSIFDLFCDRLQSYFIIVINVRKESNYARD